MTSFFARCLDGVIETALGWAEGRWLEQPRSTVWMAGAVLTVGTGLAMPEAMAQPRSVMQIPVPAPQALSVAVGIGESAVIQSSLVVMPDSVLTGEPLAIPGATVPVGRWDGRAGVKTVALAEMPWMGEGETAFAMTAPAQVSSQAQYRVVVATPSQAYVDSLKQKMPEVVALDGGRTMQAGAFVDWRHANALRRALGAYGFFVEVQGL